MACGKKFERGHEKHYCEDCANKDTIVCRTECFMNIWCHWRAK